MRAARCLRAARSSRLVDTGYIKSSFVPVAQKVQLAYPGRDRETERVLDEAEQRFEQSLSLQVLAAPVEKDIISGMTLPRSLNLPLSFMAVSRRLEAPAAAAAAKAMAEEEARTQAEGEPRPSASPPDAQVPSPQGSKEQGDNKKARKIRAANQAAAVALQGPSMPWTPPEPVIPERAKRLEKLPSGERRYLTDPLDTRRLRLSRARKLILQMAAAARKARAWTVWYDVVLVPQLSFAAAPPREETHAWPPAHHPDIYFPHTKRDWIFLHPTFVHSIFDTKSSFTATLLAPNVAPGQDTSDRDGPKPLQTRFGMRFAQLERWTRGTPLGPTRPLAGEGDPWMDRPLRLPVTDSAEEAPESAIREKITCHAPYNLIELCHASLQAEVLVAAGWTPEQVFALFPALRPKDIDSQLDVREKKPALEPEPATQQEGEVEAPEESPSDDVPGANPASAAEAGFTPAQLAEIRKLLTTITIFEQLGGLTPGEGFSPPVLAAINERAASLMALRARHAQASNATASVRLDPILLRQLPQAKAVAVHLWRLMMWRHQPFQGTDSLLNY